MVRSVAGRRRPTHFRHHPQHLGSAGIFKAAGELGERVTSRVHCDEQGRDLVGPWAKRLECRRHLLESEGVLVGAVGVPGEHQRPPAPRIGISDGWSLSSVTLKGPPIGTPGGTATVRPPEADAFSAKSSSATWWVPGTNSTNPVPNVRMTIAATELHRMSRSVLIVMSDSRYLRTGTCGFAVPAPACSLGSRYGNRCRRRDHIFCD